MSLHPRNEANISRGLIRNESGLGGLLTKDPFWYNLPFLSVSDGAKDDQLTKSEEEGLAVGSELEEDFSGSLEPGPKSYSK